MRNRLKRASSALLPENEKNGYLDSGGNLTDKTFVILAPI